MLETQALFGSVSKIRPNLLVNIANFIIFEQLHI